MAQLDDPVAAILRQAQGTDAARADAWDAFHQATNADELAARLRDLALPDAVKADLWDLKHQAAPPAAGGAMTFARVNGQDVPVEDDGVLGAAGRAWEWANTPLVPQIATAAKAIAKHMDQPSLDEDAITAQIRGFLSGSLEAAGGVAAGFTSPVGLAMTLAGVGPEGTLAKRIPALKALLELPAVRALQRTVQTGGSAAFTGEGGYRIATAQDAGDVVHGVTELAGGVAGVASGLRSPQAAAPAPRLNPAEQDAIAFGDARGIPLDAATRTGSPTLRSFQKRVANSIGGEGTAERLIGGQREALTRVAGELEDDAHPTSVQPGPAGEGVRDAVRALMARFNREASAAYEKLRGIEHDPQYSVTVHTAPVGSNTHKSLLGKLAAGLESGEAPSIAELRGMRQILEELEMQPYQRGRLVSDSYDTSDSHYARGQANADVYHDILQAAPGTSAITGAEMAAGIRKALEQGEWTNAGRGALEVARQRLHTGTTGPLLPPNTPVLGTTERVGLPVDLRQTKHALMPIYERLLREQEIAPAAVMGGKAQALVALDRLINGPDVAPASVVDGALSDLKSMARTDLPELRTTGQGIVANAIRLLEPKLQEAVRRGGDVATRALEEGRGNTQAKHFAGDRLRQLVGPDIENAEPVAIFRKLVAPKDASFNLLQRVQQLAPEEMPRLGRAYLEQLIDQAKAEGGFDKAARLQAEWQRLGPRTKRVLFQEPGQIEALDRFFLLAKRIAENPNPSGTAHVNNAFNWMSAAVSWPLAKLLYTPRGANMVARFMARWNQPTFSNAARTAALAEIAAAARDVDDDDRRKR